MGKKIQGKRNFFDFCNLTQKMWIFKGKRIRSLEFSYISNLKVRGGLEMSFENFNWWRNTPIEVKERLRSIPTTQLIDVR